MPRAIILPTINICGSTCIVKRVWPLMIWKPRKKLMMLLRNLCRLTMPDTWNAIIIYRLVSPPRLCNKPKRRNILGDWRLQPHGRKNDKSNPFNPRYNNKPISSCRPILPPAVKEEPVSRDPLYHHPPRLHNPLPFLHEKRKNQNFPTIRVIRVHVVVENAMTMNRTTILVPKDDTNDCKNNVDNKANDCTARPAIAKATPPRPKSPFIVVTIETNCNPFCNDDKHGRNNVNNNNRIDWPNYKPRNNRNNKPCWNNWDWLIWRLAVVTVPKPKRLPLHHVRM
mmetsp:Transcript_30631/g.63982  ORF Transcript_30631/g.63982 Transcript_30631/m.63982 type:complete len:282 (+) Transcript_30631:115-960(+)